MNEEFFYEILSPLIIFGLLFFAIAEFIGRSKHIGRWWTFFLMFAFFPGIIALIFSPNARKKPTKGNTIHTIFGVLFLILGVFSFFGKIDRYQLSDFFANIGVIATGFYLINFAKGKILNKNPKFFFNYLKSDFPNQVEKEQISLKDNNVHNHLYFIIENDVQTGPFSLVQLIDKRVNEETLVWRKGLENWKKALEVKEIENIILYNPPPIPSEPESNPPPIPQSEKIPNKYWINGKEYTILEIENELRKGNYLIYKDSVVYDNAGIEIFIKGSHRFEHLLKYFPPD